ncbi:hypothetical protein STEG23_014838 [Scotinomys teguina]
MEDLVSVHTRSIRGFEQSPTEALRSAPSMAPGNGCLLLFSSATVLMEDPYRPEDFLTVITRLEELGIITAPGLESDSPPQALGLWGLCYLVTSSHIAGVTESRLEPPTSTPQPDQLERSMEPAAQPLIHKPYGEHLLHTMAKPPSHCPCSKYRGLVVTCMHKSEADDTQGKFQKATNNKKQFLRLPASKRSSQKVLKTQDINVMQVADA